MIRFSILAFSVLLLVPGAVYGEQLGKRPAFYIRPEVKVRSDVVTLGQVASFSGGDEKFPELATVLKEIKLMDAPAPSTKDTITGAKILELIYRAGVPEDSFGYSIPRVVTVEREGRLLTAAEVLRVLKTKSFGDATSDLQPKEVTWTADQVIALGETRIDINPLGKVSGGRMPIRVEVFVDERPAARFLATALVDDWREVPVMKHEVERGSLISGEEIQLVRLNLLQQPSDIVSSFDEVIGRRAKSKINAGETIRKSAVDIPPIIPKGRKVSIVYRSHGLEATATGVALEDGFENGHLKVRNENSKKVIAGRVSSGDVVEVSPES